MKGKLSLKFKKSKPEAIIPQYAHEDGDAGFDLFSLEEIILKPGDWHAFNIGLQAEIPIGWYVRVAPKGGPAFKSAIQVLAGVIDSNYRGDWQVLLLNSGKEDYHIEVGDKIAQGVLEKYADANIVEVDQLSPTTRGEGHYGSTGK